MKYYKDLTIPMVLYDSIASTLDYKKLLIEELDRDLSQEELNELELVWNELSEKFRIKSNGPKQHKNFNIFKEIDFQYNRFLIIKFCCESLCFDRNTEIINLLGSEGYAVNSLDYIGSIENISKQADGILIKINHLRDLLPKEVKSNKEQITIIDIMESYASILGFDFDFYTISAEKFISREKQVKTKIKAIEEQYNNKKK